MQKLHLVGFTTDHKSLILSARRGARSGGFVLAIDEEVASAVAEAVEAADADGVGDDVEEALPASPPKPQSALSVKELQARLRAGRSIESVATEAGVDAEWVTRFAMPVLAEQARVIDATKNATFSRARLGPSAMPLGSSVYRNLVAKGVRTPVDELDAGWTTRQAADGRWLVTFDYSSRGKRHRAVWELDLRGSRGSEVKAIDRLASELAFVAGAPPAVSVPAPSKPAKRADQPSDIDRANARRVAEARKQAAAQLAEAARQGSKRSVEAARRAGAAKPKTPKHAAKPTRAGDPVAAVRQAAAALLTDDLGSLTEELPTPSALPRAADRRPAVVTAVEDDLVDDESVDAEADDEGGYEDDADESGGYDEADGYEDGDEGSGDDDTGEFEEAGEYDEAGEYEADGDDDGAGEVARPVRARPVEARRRPVTVDDGADRPVRAARRSTDEAEARAAARPARSRPVTADRPVAARSSERPRPAGTGDGAARSTKRSRPAAAGDRPASARSPERARSASAGDRPASARSLDRTRPVGAGDRPVPSEQSRPAAGRSPERARPAAGDRATAPRSPERAGGGSAGERPAARRVAVRPDAGTDDRTRELPRVTPDRPAAAAARPSRALTRAVGTADDLRGSAPAAEPRRSPIRFRDDLAAPAGRNGDGPAQPGRTAGADRAGGAEASRRRRSEPLRAR